MTPTACKHKRRYGSDWEGRGFLAMPMRDLPLGVSSLLVPTMAPESGWYGTLIGTIQTLMVSLVEFN